MESLAAKIERTIQAAMPAGASYILPEDIALVIESLEAEDQDIAIAYLNQAVLTAEPVSTSSDKWAVGWKESLNMYKRTNNCETLAPLYSGKLPYIRLFRQLYKTKTRATEEDTYKTLEHILFSELYDSVIGSWITSHSSSSDGEYREPIDIVEIGCGSCQHIPRLNKKLSKEGRAVRFHSSDWSESSGLICEELKAREGIDINFKQIDLLSDNLKEHSLPSGAYVYTVNALEQLGNNSWKTIEWLISQSPRLVMHFEPVIEILEPSNALDRLSIDYINKRSYLSGLYGTIKTHEALERLSMLTCRRTFIANAHHENNTFICWVPTV